MAPEVSPGLEAFGPLWSQRRYRIALLTASFMSLMRDPETPSNSLAVGVNEDDIILATRPWHEGPIFSCLPGVETCFYSSPGDLSLVRLVFTVRVFFS